MPEADQSGGPDRGTAAGARATGRVSKICSLASYTAVLDEIAVVAAIDVNGTFIFVNDQFVRTSRFTRDELIGAHHRIVEAQQAEAGGRAAMYRQLAGGKRWRGEIVRQAKDGSRHWFDTAVFPAQDSHGRTLGYITVGIDITSRKEAEATLRRNEQRARELSELASDWYWEQDAELRFTAMSDGLHRGGLQPEALIGRKRWELPIQSDPEAMRRHRATLEAHEPFRDFEYSMPSSDGKTQEWFSISANPIFNEHGKFGGYRGVARCVTSRVQAERALRERNDILQAIIDNFPGGISLIDENLRVVATNAQMRKLLDLPDTLFASGPPRIEDVWRFNAERGDYGRDIDVEELIKVRLAEITDPTPHGFERERPDGTIVEIRGAPLKKGGFVRTYMDVTERRRSEAKIAHMARHDALTDIPNRVLLLERLDEAIEECGERKSFAVLYLDVDRFKLVNDTFGHAAGDALLKGIAARLRECVRDRDTVARLSGDEFAIVQLSAASPKDASALAQRITGIMGAPFDVCGHRMFVGASIGIAFWPSNGSSAGQLLRSADLALYRAKSDGRGTHCFFEPEMDARMQARRELELDLRAALVNGEFELDYQPILDLARNEISGCEALLRWNHPRRGRVPPSDFVPLAEETGLILPISEWVLRQACADAVSWPEHVKLAVNLSAIQFKSRTVVQAVFNALAASGFDSSRLELEITETVFLQDTELVLSILHQLRGLGVRIAMDDFGVGYSSLAYLQRFPFDKIKIDRGFIAQLSEATSSVAILGAIANLGRSLGMTTTAEGVETPEQLARVRDEGCSEVQGYLFSRPLPVTELEAFFGNTSQARQSAA